MIKLSIVERTADRKSDAKKVRREGGIPAILYGKGHAPRTLSLKKEEFLAVLRNLKSGHLATTVFELHDGTHVRRALVKEVQYQPATYAIEHVDFVELKDDVLVTVNVAIQLVGVAESPGVKLGGTVRHVIRSLAVRCLPKDLPKEFFLDIAQLDLAQSKRLSDIVLPPNVRPLAKLNEVAVVIAKKAA
jgi:large subunit ribosomal protein L25